MNKRLLAILMAVTASLIYGANFTITKDVTPLYVMPYGFILIRVCGASVFFWIFSLFGPKEKIDKKDYFRIAAAAFFGVGLNMLTFFKGLSYTSPISAAVIMVCTPIIVLLLSAVLIQEKITLKKGIGIVLGLFGTSILILYGKPSVNAPNETLGNLLVLINAVSYGLYLIIIKKIIAKYHPFTFIKWMYLLGILFALPFGFSEFREVNWTEIPNTIMLEIGFVIVFTTVATYLLNLFAMKHLKPSTLSVFIYLQPFFATIIAIGTGNDSLNSIKIIASVLLFFGVYLVIEKQANVSK